MVLRPQVYKNVFSSAWANVPQTFGPTSASQGSYCLVRDADHRWAIVIQRYGQCCDRAVPSCRKALGERAFLEDMRDQPMMTRMIGKNQDPNISLGQALPLVPTTVILDLSLFFFFNFLNVYF